MKEWQQNHIGSTVVIISGICLMLWANTIEIPQAYRTFFGIPYEVNPEYRFAFFEVMGALLVGVLIIGVGLGLLSNTYSIYRLEKKLASEKASLPPLP